MGANVVCAGYPLHFVYHSVLYGRQDLNQL